MDVEYKIVRDVFRDFNTSGLELMESKVKTLNLFKKTNTLEAVLLSDKYINIKDIYNFEKYIEVRFAISNIKIKVEIEKEDSTEGEGACEKAVPTEIENLIEKGWSNIIDYMSYKHPMTKAILSGSTIAIDNKNVNIMLSKKGKDFLIARRFDEILSEILLNVYGIKYKVNYIEEISKEDMLKIQENNQKMQEELIRQVQEQSQINSQEEENNMPPPPPDVPFDDSYFGEAPVPSDEEYLQELEQMDEEANVILGKLSKAKETKIKIKEISAETNKRITIEGRIVTCDVRETKSGKGMIIYELYDGSGIITCKSFTKDIKEGNEVVEKIRKASGIKTIGKAGLDSFAGDVTVMANVIVEVDGENFPKLPTEDENSPLILGMNLEIKEPLIKIGDLNVESGNVCIDGEVISMEDRELKGGKILLSIDIYDGTSTMTCKAFLTKVNSKKVIGRIKGAKGIKLAGKAGMDTFSNEITIMANTILESTGIKKETRMDNSEEKRVELHMHTQMSQMDAVTSAEDLIKRAIKWGMKSIAITDHGVVQAFPAANHVVEDNPNIKVIYGVEAYLVPDKSNIVTNSKNQDLDTTYCVLDLETTGLSFRTEKITEVGIMKVKNGEVIDSFSCFVNPEKPIPPKVVEVTNITDDMVKDAETIDKVMPKLLEFIGDSVLVAHNADFDIGFLKHNAKELGYSLDNTYMDTLKLAKQLFPDFKKYKLGMIAEKLGIKEK